jgi:hypothetical protein
MGAERGAQPAGRGAAHWAWLSVGLVLMTSVVGEAVPRERAAPRRADVVATFSAGTGFLEVDGRIVQARIRAGWMSLATDDAQCVPEPEHPCTHHINELRFRLEDMVIPLSGRRTYLSELTINNGRHMGTMRDWGEGVPVRPGAPLVLRGRWNGDPFDMWVDGEMDDAEEVATLVVMPHEGRATVFARLSGTVDGVAVRGAFMATADTPFLNRPPVVDAGPPVQAVTNCIASVAVDASGTFDPDDNLRTAFFTINRWAMARADEPLLLPPSNHHVTLVAEDVYGGRGFDATTVTVVDDGTSDPLQGAHLVSFRVPAGTEPERFALATLEHLAVGDAAVLDEEGAGAPVASLGTVLLGDGAHVGETYAITGAVLDGQAHVEGPLYTEGDVELGPAAQVDGGIVGDGSWLPGTVLSFHVPLGSTQSSEVVAGSGDHVVIPPGAYDRIVVEAGGTLEMQPGVYAARAMHVEADGTLMTAPFAGEVPTILAVTEEISYAGTVQSAVERPSLLVAYGGEGTWHLPTGFAGWIVAPDAELVLEGDEYQGGFVGRAVRVLDGSTIHHRPLSWKFVRDARGACAVEPRVTCVRHNASGSYTAVFGYLNRLPRYGQVVPIGVFNRMDPGGPWLGQNLGFFPNAHPEAFEVEFDTHLVWTLGGRQVIATPESPPCP